MLALALITLGTIPHEQVVVDRVDVIEVNHYYDAHELDDRFIVPKDERRQLTIPQLVGVR